MSYVLTLLKTYSILYLTHTHTNMHLNTKHGINHPLPYTYHGNQTRPNIHLIMAYPIIHLAYMSWHEGIHHNTNPNHTSSRASSQILSYIHASSQTLSSYHHIHPRKKHVCIKKSKQTCEEAQLH